MKPRSLRRIILVLVALLLVGGLVYRSRDAIGLKDFSWTYLAQSLRHARISLLLISLAAIYLAYLIRAQRWVRFCRYLGRANLLRVYAATLVGFFGIVLLGRAGEPLRPLLIARKERMSTSAMFGIYVLERVFDTASTVVLVGLSLLVFPHLALAGRGGEGWLAVARTTGVAMLAVLVAATAFLIYFRLHGAGAMDRALVRWRSHHGWRARLAGLFAGFGEGLQAIRSSGDLVAAIVYSAVHWALVVFIYKWITASFGGRLAELDLPAAMLVLAVTMVGSTMQLPGVGGGSQVASFLALTLFFGVEKEPAAAAAIVLWLITFAGSSLAGAPLLVREGWSMGELRRLAEAEREAEASGTHLADPADPTSSGAAAI